MDAPLRARRWAESMLAGAPWAGDFDVALVVSELCTNAVLHTDDDFRISIDETPTTLRVTVHDHSPAPPERRLAEPDCDHGRGLAIVESVATWGWCPAPDGKDVWAELPRR